MSIVHIQGIGDSYATAIETGLDGPQRGSTPRTVILTEGEATEAAARIALMDECLLTNETINVPGMVRQPEVVVIGGSRVGKTARIAQMLREKGCTVRVNTGTGTSGADTTDPFGRDRNGMTKADRERAAWNEAVDMRKAARADERVQRRWGLGNNVTGDWVSEWAEGGAS